LVFLILAVITAVAALSAKDLLSAIVLLSAFSFIMCLLWTEMGAVDVAFTEAAVGAGVSTAFFIAALFNTTRRTKD
jgi:energy-converting hydrogenase B subunit D